MRAAWRWIRKFWWLVLAILGSAVGVLWYAFGGRSSGGSDPKPTPSFAKKAKEKAEKVRLEGEVEKAKVKAKADTERAEIERIEELGETDPKEARRQISDLLRRTL